MGKSRIDTGVPGSISQGGVWSASRLSRHGLPKSLGVARNYVRRGRQLAARLVLEAARSARHSHHLPGSLCTVLFTLRFSQGHRSGREASSRSITIAAGVSQSFAERSPFESQSPSPPRPDGGHSRGGDARKERRDAHARREL